MNTTTRRQYTAVLLLSLLVTSIHAQRLSFAFSPIYSMPLNSKNDSLLFRGNGAGFRFGADYFFGKAGIGFSSGFGSSSADDATINNFLKGTAIPPDQLTITKTRQQNMYLLAGPSFRTGNMVELYAHAKAGVFINNSGLVSIQQKGAQRAAYRNESTDKSLYPGFLTGLGIQYKGKSDVWSVGVSVDYMNTKSEVNNYDARRGGGIEALKLSRNITDVVAGLTVRYNILSPRDHASGQASGRRLLPTVNKREIVSPRDPSSGLPTGRMDGSTESCGPVVQRITNPDGTTEERTFSCPADAAQYNRLMQTNGNMPNRISTNMTVGKQTQGATFGEKVNQGLHAAGGALANGASMGIISGTLTWSSPDAGAGIISNRSIVGGTTSIAGTPGTSRQTQNTSFGGMVRLSANGGDVCNPCLATTKMANVKNNPLYEGANKTIGNKIDENCDGIAGVDISLIDINSSAIVATTKTEACGNFFFANVPEGAYIVRLTATLVTKKGYDVSLKSKTDLSGDIEQSDASVLLTINGGNENTREQQSAASSKSISIIEADLDGDGEFESLRANATFSDGSSQDITADIKSGTTGIVLQENALKMRRRVDVLKSNKQADPDAKRISSVTISHNNNKLKATATYSDGSSQDITESLSSNTENENVRQYNIGIADLDGDGVAEASINTTRSNIKHSSMTAENTDDNGIWSPRSNRKMIPITENELSGDGTTTPTAGNKMPTEFAVIRQRSSTHFETGDMPTSQQRPGAPIKGVIVKGGRNPSPDLVSRTTNENGEFEFKNLEAGDYTFTIERTLLLNDETVIWVKGDESAEKNINTSEANIGKGDIKVSSSQNSQTLRAQNNNTVRSNRTELKSILVEADLDGDGVYETDVTSKVNDELVLDENGQPEAPTMKAGISTSRSNIRTRNGFQSMGNELYISRGIATINNKDVPVQSVLKTKHDTVKNSINNVR